MTKIEITRYSEGEHIVVGELNIDETNGEITGSIQAGESDTLDSELYQPAFYFAPVPAKPAEQIALEKAQASE